MRSPQLQTLAIILGAAPLLTGTIIYGAWRTTRWDWLIVAGLLTIVAGIAAFFAGMFSLAAHLRDEWKFGRTPAGRLGLQGMLIGSLLLLNFPAAAFFTISAVEVMERYTVSVHNECDIPIESLVVSAPGVDVELGPIAPGQRVQHHFHVQSDGALTFNARQQGIQFGGVVEGYVTNGVGGIKSIRVIKNGQFEIQSNEV